MNSYLSLILLSVMTLEARGACDGVTVDGVYHDREMLMTGLDYYYQIAVDYSLNILYINLAEYERSRVAEFNLEAKTLRLIEDVPTGFTQAVDQKTHTAYIGGHKGLYKYSPITKETQLISSDSIESIHFKDNLYYCTKDVHKTFVLDGEPKLLDGFDDRCPYKLVIDRDNEAIFRDCHNIMYRQKLGSDEAISFGRADGYTIVATDVHGEVYVTMVDGVYTLNKCNNTIAKVLDVAYPRGLGFDRNNNMIYIDDRSMYRLKPDAGKICQP